MYNSLNIKITRTPRKTVGISVKNGTVQLNVPRRISENEIQNILRKSEPWIQKQLQKQAGTRQPPKQFVHGELFSCLGELYPLQFVDSQTKKIRLLNYELQVPTPRITCPEKKHNYLYKKMRDWYIEYAESVLREKTHFYAEQMGLRYQSIRIKQYKSRWGSCSSKGEISFSWQLILAPEWIVDYVVVHEIAHLKHMNHSPRFWRLVATVVPNHLECRKWLREHGAGLRID